MDLYKDEIYVFTPTGELIKLAKGATVLDFAFAIHTKLGSKCVSAKSEREERTDQIHLEQRR